MNIANWTYRNTNSTLALILREAEGKDVDGRVFEIAEYRLRYEGNCLVEQTDTVVIESGNQWWIRQVLENHRDKLSDEGWQISSSGVSGTPEDRKFFRL